MWPFIIKIVLTSAIVVAVAELARRSSLWAAVLASVPLTSLLAFVWLYLESGSTDKVAMLSQSIFWLVIPSLPMFVLLPLLLRSGINFWLSLAGSCTVTVLAYLAMVWSLRKLGIHL